jgi:hypothetical protein
MKQKSKKTMKIKLVRTGGFIPVTKAAEADVELSEEDLATLLGKIKSDPSASRIKDGNYWELTSGDKVTAIDPERVPDEYKDLFEKLKEKLRIIKP